jgi:transcriptional regulator with XRE-family HTH domain
MGRVAPVRQKLKRENPHWLEAHKRGEIMDKPELPSLAERVRWARRRLKLTQAGLADKIGASREYVTKIETGDRIRPRNMDVLAKALDVSPAWLQFGAEEIDQLSREAITLALRWQDLPPEVQAAVKTMIDAAADKKT